VTHIHDAPAAGGAVVARGLPTRGYAARSAGEPLGPFEFERRVPGPKDVRIEILFCGVCHSDLHQARDEWGGSLFPMVPGHEIIGRVAEVGGEVTRVAVGETAGVGCMVDSCGHCVECRQGLEQFCLNTLTFTYNSPDPIMGGPTHGGYSSQIVVDQDFVLRVSDGLDPAGAAPLLCAGITTWSPLRHWQVGPGQRVGIVGLGGLGHMGVKFARALGADVSLFTTSPGKADDARRLGADEVIISRDEQGMMRHGGRFDFIIDTVAAPHDLDAYLNLLKRDGTLCLVGVPDQPHPSPSAFSLISRRRSLSGSLIGGIKETQEMLDFCAERGVVSDVEVIRMDQINEAYERMLKSDVKYRFSIDLATLAGA
jgi:uncharacterized zinc-type alcohol dehydrogenase-like protein